jgi:hypothetical protein
MGRADELSHPALALHPSLDVSVRNYVSGYSPGMDRVSGIFCGHSFDLHGDMRMEHP